MPDVPDARTDDRFEHLLAAWGRSAALGDRLSGGNRNDVREVQINGKRHAARLSPRSAVAIAWELDLLAMLDKDGLRVPLPVQTAEGGFQHEGMVVFTWLAGEPPARDDDWPPVVRYLDRLHTLTTGWPQRPGFRGTRELLTETTGGDVDLSLMPADAVALCRDAWRPLVNAPRSVIHGDPGPDNIRISREGVGFLDWDECRVDATLLDFAFLPASDPVISPPRRLEAARQAALAWEAANGWTIEPNYARRCLESISGAIAGG